MHICKGYKKLIVYNLFLFNNDLYVNIFMDYGFKNNPRI